MQSPKKIPVNKCFDNFFRVSHDKDQTNFQANLKNTRCHQQKKGPVNFVFDTTME
jgi:hypothetical protein